MKLPDFDRVTDDEISNIGKYHYKHLSHYLDPKRRQANANWFRGTLLGQMYENVVYEKLLKWAGDSNDVRDFILKGPYRSNGQANTQGFVYDTGGEIYYLSSGETIGEFDALYRCGNVQYHVEVMNTEYKEQFDALPYELMRKSNLLRILFPQSENACLLVTTYSKEVNLRELPYVTLVRTPKYNLDPDILKLQFGRLSPPLSQNGAFKTINDIQYFHFDYLKTLQSLQEQATRAEPKSLGRGIPVLMAPYIGLIERLFLGKMSSGDFDRWLARHDTKPLEVNLCTREVFFAVKIKDAARPVLAVYLAGDYNRYYEIMDLKSLKVKAIEPRKRTTRDISHFANTIRSLSDDQADEYLDALGCSWSE